LSYKIYIDKQLFARWFKIMILNSAEEIHHGAHGEHGEHGDKELKEYNT